MHLHMCVCSRIIFLLLAALAMVCLYLFTLVDNFVLCLSCISLLSRCLLDSDDEVRDRALLYLEVLKRNQKSLTSSYILNRGSLTDGAAGPMVLTNVEVFFFPHLQLSTCRWWA